MSTSDMSYRSALRESIRDALRRDSSILLLGEDIGRFGGAFKVTEGLLDEFGPERVIDTPISETAIIGVTIGAALGGFRPVTEIMYMDFLQLAMEQLVTQASKVRFLSGGKLAVPLVIRTQYNLGRMYGPQHSQFFASWFLQAPGLKVVLPATPADVKGLFNAAVQDSNPVLFIESAALYGLTGPVPQDDYVVPLGLADVKHSGKHLTIIALSRVVPEALAAADVLGQEGIEAEVVDPRTVQPLDVETLAASVEKTGRVLVATDEMEPGGIGSALVGALLPRVFYSLQAPPSFVCSPRLSTPAARHLEEAYMVNRDKIVGAARQLVAA